MQVDLYNGGKTVVVVVKHVLWSSVCLCYGLRTCVLQCRHSSTIFPLTSSTLLRSSLSEMMCVCEQSAVPSGDCVQCSRRGDIHIADGVSSGQRSCCSDTTCDNSTGNVHAPTLLPTFVPDIYPLGKLCPSA